MLFTMALALTAHSQVSKVEVTTNTLGNFELQRNGVPYYIKGAGAKAHFDPRSRQIQPRLHHRLIRQQHLSANAAIHILRISFNIVNKLIYQFC